MTMNNSDTTEENRDPGRKENFFRRLLGFLDFSRPGTKQELEHDIQELLEEGEEDGLISPLEEKMINSILEFRETYASEIMTPAAEVISFDAASPLSELIDIVVDSGFTRIPIYHENPDQIIGAIHAKDLIQLCNRQQPDPVNWESYLRPVYFISESKPIVDLLREFQKRKVHMAMVTDEFGTVRGLVTLEDILEEIVGEIDDEYDEEEDAIEVVADQVIQVHARVDRELIEEFFDVELPDGPYESVGGLVIHALGRLAVAGDTVEVGGLRFEVKSASDRLIKLVKISRIDESEQEQK